MILRSLLHQFEHHAELSHKPELRLSIERLAQRLAWLDAEIVALRDRAHLLQEETMLKNAEQTNRNLQVLAIASTLFLPASLVAAVFGMNFENIPFGHERAGFGWALAGGDFRTGVLAAAKIGAVSTLGRCRAAPL